jgi:hypothetical protein
VNTTPIIINNMFIRIFDEGLMEDLAKVSGKRKKKR